MYIEKKQFSSTSFILLWRHEVDLCSRVWSQIAWHTATHALDTWAERALLWSSKCQPPSPSTLMVAVIDLQCGHKYMIQWQHSWSELLLWMLSVTKHEWEQLHDIFQRMRWDEHQTAEQTSKSANENKTIKSESASASKAPIGGFIRRWCSSCSAQI